MQATEPSPAAEMFFHHARGMRADRIVALGRLTLAAYAYVAITLEPPESDSMETLTYALLYVFIGYAAVRAFAVWRRPAASRRWQIVRHVTDLAFFTAFSILTNPSNSIFFVGFVFCVVCAALLFSSAATAWTAAGVIGIYITISAVGFSLPHAPAFTPSRFVLRIAFLCVIAALLIEVKLHEQRLHSDARKVAAWPRGVPPTITALATELLQRSAEILRVSRAMIVWDTGDSPALHIATCDGPRMVHAEESIDAIPPIVDPSFRGSSFLVSNKLALIAAKTAPSDDVLRLLAASPIDATFRKRFNIGDVLASRFSGETVSGWLFVLDRQDVTTDDLVMVDVVAGLVEARLEQFYLGERLRERALSEERVRLARDLHDGILQSLSGTAVHLECLRHLIKNDPSAALFSLIDLEKALADDQREVRSFVARLRFTVADEDVPRLGVRLAALAERIQREWGLKVEVDVSPISEIIGVGMTEEVYRIAKEALTNAAMHSHASRVMASVGVRNERAVVVIEDNGHGFPFTGDYDLDTLMQIKRGPLTLKERIIALHGSMRLKSDEHGVRLEIELPMTLVGVPA